MSPPTDLSGSVGGPEGSQKASQGAADDGSDALPKFAQIFNDFMTYFNSENEATDELEIVKKYIQIIAKRFYMFS